VHPRKK